jgi:hypothetical protein
MARRTKTTDQELYLLISEVREHGYYKLTARVRTRHYDQLTHGYAPSSVDDEYASGYLYSGLWLTAQGDGDSQREPADRQPIYGERLAYHEPYRCGRYEVRRMYKTLETVHKRLEKLAERRGTHRSFGEYCGRLAEALGCTGIVVEQTPDGYNVSGQRWVWLSIGDGVNRINHKVYLWQREAMATPATAEASTPAADASGEEEQAS